jgi:hypothetical protein
MQVKSRRRRADLERETRSQVTGVGVAQSQREEESLDKV